MDRGDLVGPVVIHSADAVRYANREFCDLVGVDSPAALAGRPPAELVAEPDRHRFTDSLDRLRNGTEPVAGLQVELERTDGTQTNVIVMSSPAEWGGEPAIHTSVMNLVDEDVGAAPSYEAASNHAPIGVTIADADADDEPLIYVNDAFAELTGYSKSEAVGRNCRYLQGPGTREEPVAELRAAIDEERSTTVELRNYRKDDSLFWNRVSITPVRDADGNVRQYLGFQEDVSETKLREREKTLFETHAEMSEQVMYVVDADRRIKYVNPAFERVTGYAAAEAVGRSPRFLRASREDDARYEEMWATAAAGEVWEGELTNRTKRGELYRSEGRVVPVLDDRNAVTHFAVIEPDVTDRRLVTQALDVLNRILRHNVRTSVNVIDGYVDLLASGVDDDERETAIQAIRERTTALEDISEHTTALRNLLDSRGSSSPLQVSEIAALVDRYRTIYPDAVVDLEIRVPGDRSIRNGTVFRIAFDEIVENAVVHSDADHPHVEIAVAESGVDDAVEISVADDGPGIPESEWAVVQTGTETPLRHGNSIGLWLIYWSVTALGGSIELSDNDPRGTRFTLRVPVAAPSPETPDTGERA